MEPAERQPKRNVPPNPKLPPPALSLLVAAIQPPSSPPSRPAQSMAAPNPFPAEAFPPPPPPPPLRCLPAPVRAQSMRPPIAPPANLCWTRLHTSAAPEPAAKLPPSRSTPAALPSSAARILCLLLSALLPCDISPPIPANPTPVRSIPPARATSAEIFSRPSPATSPAAPRQFRASAPQPASPCATASSQKAHRPSTAPAAHTIAAPASSPAPLFHDSHPAPSPSPAIAPSPPLPVAPLAATLLSIPATAVSRPCSVDGIHPVSTRVQRQSVSSIPLWPLPARLPPPAQSFPPARPGRALRPADPAPVSDSRPNSHTTPAANSPPCIEISSRQFATRATAPTFPFAAPADAILSRPASAPAPGSSPPGCLVQPHAPCAQAPARNSSRPSHQTFPPLAAPHPSLRSHSSPETSATAPALHRSRFPVSPPTLPAPACPAALPVAEKVFSQSSASPAMPDPDPPPPSPPPKTGISATPRASHVPHPRPAPCAPPQAP